MIIQIHCIITEKSNKLSIVIIGLNIIVMIVYNVIYLQRLQYNPLYFNFLSKKFIFGSSV